MPTDQELLRERLARIDQLKAELLDLQRSLDDYKEATVDHAADVGTAALDQLRATAEHEGYAVALAYAEEVFSRLATLIDPDDAFSDAARLLPSQAVTREYAQRQKRFVGKRIQQGAYL